MIAIPKRPKIVLLGMMARMPVAGVVWQTVHYLVGLERLGYEVYYVEAHANAPLMFVEHPEDDGVARSTRFLGEVMGRFDLGDRWAFHALHADGGAYGPAAPALGRLFRDAALVINLHGATRPLPEHYAAGRLVYLETDPVRLQIELFHGEASAIGFLEPHCAFFTFGENYGRPSCGLPVSDRYHFHATRQPVVADFWATEAGGPAGAFTTIGNWRQEARDVRFRGEVYHWSKHHEFLKCLDLPARTGQVFELALTRFGPDDQGLLESNGWKVRRCLDFSLDLDEYRGYIAGSRGEFTVAKDQNIRLRSGWFSDRSATYLAAGRPVITQETGFSEILPTGAGLIGFNTVDEAAEAVARVNADYPRHSRAAAEVARAYFDSDVVLSKLLAEVGA